MNFWDIALVILLAVILTAAVIYRLRRRKRGCGCGCEDCSRQCFRRKRKYTLRLYNSHRQPAGRDRLS